MRVVHVLPQISARIGGPAVSVVESSLALRERGIEAVIFATDMAHPVSARRHQPVSPRDLPAGADLLDIRIVESLPPRRIAFAPALQGALDAEVPRADLVHLHMLYMYPQFAAYRAARRHGVPYVVSPCGALDPHLRARSRSPKALMTLLWQRRMLALAAAIHYKTAEEARLCGDIGIPAPASVVPNGVRWQAFQELPDPAPFRATHGLAGPVVLHLGRLSHKKGLDVLIRAFAIAARELPAARLVIAGPDDEELTPSMRAVADSEGVASRVVFTGMLRGDERLAALAAADVFALPSHTENFGVAVVEAMAAGLPVAVSPAVNIAADIAEAGAGVVAPNNVPGFAPALAALLRAPDWRADLGARARAFARRYDWPAVAPQLEAMYRAAAGREPQRVLLEEAA